MTITQRLNKIRQQIPPSVLLIGVTKQVSVSAIREAYEAGVRDFAESRLQEAIPKQEQLEDLKDISWHFIGHLQTNKAKKVLEHFDWIHCVDNLKLAQRLNQLVQEGVNSPKLCLQVKILPDPNKYGWHILELLGDLAELEKYKNLKIEGLMTILPLGLSELEILSAFDQTRQLAQTLKQQSSLSMEQLSMGMSSDYLFAIQQGATMIRLGRIIFGDRD